MGYESKSFFKDLMPEKEVIDETYSDEELDNLIGQVFNLQKLQS